MKTIHIHRQVGQTALPAGGLGILLGWLLALWLPLALAGLPDTPVPGAYVTDGEVNAIVIDGATTYIGGKFTRLGPATGGGVPLDASSGAAAAYPQVNGIVYAVAADGSGGWYVGGRFTQVGNLPRHNIAHVLADGSVDASWNPNADGWVFALAVGNGKVFAGGRFTQIGGQARNRIAALEPNGTGAADASWNPNADGTVWVLAVSGSTVYAGGAFGNIGGQALNNLAALASDGTGAADANWNPNPDATVRALAVSGGTVYVGGEFYNIGGQSRNSLAALSVGGTGAADASWDPSPDSWVTALTVDGGVVYVGGYFSSIGGQSRNAIAAVNGSGTGAATAWNPDANYLVTALAVYNGLVYAGGEFTQIGGLPRNYLAALSPTTGLADAQWNPNPNRPGTVSTDTILALATSGGKVYVGGGFSSFGGVTRNGLAALTTATGIPTAWNPNVSGTGVNALALKQGTLYVGGEFTGIGGQSRQNIAAFSTATGQLDATWVPNADNIVRALAVSSDGSTVYVGGLFTQIGGQGRTYIAALNPVGSGGTATGWNPIAEKFVLALALGSHTLYAGGEYCGGEDCRKLIAIDTDTGAVDANWNPNPDAIIFALNLSADGNTLYAGGSFFNIGGQPHNYLAALASGTGLATAWNPNPDDILYSLAVNGGTVFAGGTFNHIGGQSRVSIAALDSEGVANAWNPRGENYFVEDEAGKFRAPVLAIALSADGNTAYLGGDLSGFGGYSRSYLGLFRLAAGNANLSNLASSGGALVPTFDSATIAYTQNVGNGTTSLTVTPTFGDDYATATLSLNGGAATAIANGATSSPLALNIGDNTVAITVTAEDGTTTKTYTLTVTRAKADTSTVVSSSLNPSAPGQSVTFTATVTPSATGTVEFFDGASSLGTASLNGSSQASVSTSALALGSHSITGVYAGNAGFNGSTSPVLTQTVNTPASLSAAVTGKSGTLNGIRTWSVTVTNNGGSTASAATLDSFWISLSGRCQPTASTGFPVSLGDIAAGQSATGQLTINFTGCVKLAKFNASVGYSANSGAVSGSTPMAGVEQ